MTLFLPLTLCLALLMLAIHWTRGSYYSLLPRFLSQPPNLTNSLNASASREEGNNSGMFGLPPVFDQRYVNLSEIPMDGDLVDVCDLARFVIKDLPNEVKKKMGKQDAQMEFNLIKPLMAAYYPFDPADSLQSSPVNLSAVERHTPLPSLPSDSPYRDVEKKEMGWIDSPRICLKPKMPNIMLDFLSRVHFAKIAQTSRLYFEWGSGASTRIIPNIMRGSKHNIGHSVRAYSTENNPDWYQILEKEWVIQCLVSAGILDYSCKCPAKTEGFGYMRPLPGGYGREYVEHIDAIASRDGITSFDFIFIDGRFRVACGIRAWRYASPDSIVAIDDALREDGSWDPRNYQSVLDIFYDNISFTCGGSGFEKSPRVQFYKPKLRHEIPLSEDEWIDLYERQLKQQG